MTIKYGIDPEAGFVIEPTAQLQADYDAFMKAGPLGQSAGTNADGSIPVATIAGQIKTFFADAFSGLWQLAQGIYTSFDPNQVSGAAQDALNSITGSLREPKAFSTVTETCTGVPGTAIQSGSQVSLGATGNIFASTASAVIGSAITAWAAAVYALAARVTTAAGVWQATVVNLSAALVAPRLSAPAWVAGTFAQYSVVADSNGNLWYDRTAGNHASSGALFPATPTVGQTYADPGGLITWVCARLAGTSAFADANVSWQFLGVGTGVVDIPFQATVVGPVGAAAGSLTNILTPIFGWNGAYNVLAASVGALQQTDASFRLSREAELHSTGNAQVDAIRRAVLQQIDPVSEDAVTACAVFQNTSDATSTGVSPPAIPSGMPPHSVLIVADYAATSNPALEALIAQAIWNTVGDGISTTWAFAGAVPYYDAGTTYGAIGTSVLDPMTGNVWQVSTAYAGGPGGALAFPATGTLNATTTPGAGTLVFTLRQFGNGLPKTGTPIDTQGNTQVVYWVRPSVKTIDVHATVFYDSSTSAFPLADADALFKGGTLQSGAVTPGVLPTYFASFPAGRNVWISALINAFFSGSPDTAGSPSVPGILDVTVSLPAAMVPISAFERAVAGTNTLTFTGEAP